MTSIARHRHRGLIMTSYGTILTRRDMMAGRTNFGYFSRQKSRRCLLGGGELSWVPRFFPPPIFPVHFLRVYCTRFDVRETLGWRNFFSSSSSVFCVERKISVRPILLQNSRRYFVDISDGGIAQISHDLISTKYPPSPGRRTSWAFLAGKKHQVFSPASCRRRNTTRVKTVP